MMEEMYGVQTIADYYEQTHPMPLPAARYYQDFESPPIHERTPIFGSEQMFPATSAVSDAASIQRSKGSDDDISFAIRAKIASHPLYPKLLEAYLACQKVGAPPDVVNLFDEIFREKELFLRSAASSCFGDDPELDEFMGTYCEVLVKYKSDLARSFDEATTFINSIERQLSNLCNGTYRSYVSEEAAGSSEEDLSTVEVEVQESDQISEHRGLKDKLLSKYSGYISSLKHEFSNKKKKGKLPREAKQILLDWWNIHNKWPYPTEVDKVSLAESTGLDQKQINNWFINQRKRHWKPSENMQFNVMDSLYGSFSMNN